jgi:hypothetical protein
VRQRNDTPYPWTFAAQPAVPATDDIPERPATEMFAVQPGETTDRPVLLDGWTAVEDEQPAAEPDSDKTDKPAARKRATSDDSKGGEPK